MLTLGPIVVPILGPILALEPVPVHLGANRGLLDFQITNTEIPGASLGFEPLAAPSWVILVHNGPKAAPSWVIMSRGGPKLGHNGFVAAPS